MRTRVTQARPNKTDNGLHQELGWLALLLVLVGVLVLLIPLAARNAPVVGGDGKRLTIHEYQQLADETRNLPRALRHPLQRQERHQPRTGCSPDEQLDPELGRCMPRPKYPDAMEQALMSTQETPCNDFYEMACGAWTRSHQDESRAFSSIFVRNQHTVADIVRSAPPGDPVHSFYTACIETLVERKHAQETAVQAEYQLARVAAQTQRYADLPGLFARLMRNGLVAPFSLSIENHPRQARMVPLLRRDGFLNLRVRENFEEVVSIFSSNNPAPLARRKAQRIFEVLQILNNGTQAPQRIEDYLQYLHSPTGLSHDLVPWSRVKGWIQARNPEFSFYQFLETLGGHALLFEDSQEVWVLDQAYFQSFDLRALSLVDWGLYAEFSVLVGAADFYPDLEDDVYFRAHHPAKQRRFGLLRRDWSKQASRKRRRDAPAGPTPGDCVHITHKMLPGLISHAYAGRAGLEQGDYVRVQRMVEGIRDEFALLLEESTWLDASTRERAKAKIKAIRVRVGHPEAQFWPLEPFAAQLTPDRYARNIDLVRQYRVRRDLGLWRNGGTWFDLDEIARFGAPLSTVNAFYSPTTNSIVVFAGIMQFPFFHPRFDDPSMFAGLGVVVGHELSHSMDPFGSQFDQWGSYRQWWRRVSQQALKDRLQCVARQYEPPLFCGPIPDYGNKTLGEDTADLVGVKLAFRAWKRLHAPEDYSAAAQHWFIIYAQSWCASYSEEVACARISGDPHPLPRMRVRETLRNLPEFRETYSCSPGHPMVHEPPCVVYGGE